MQQQFANGLLRAIGIGRDLPAIIRHHRILTATKGCDRGSENHARPGAERTAGGKHGQRAMQIDLHAEIEIGLRRRTHHRGQMKHHFRPRRHGGSHRRRVRHITAKAGYREGCGQRGRGGKVE